MMTQRTFGQSRPVESDRIGSDGRCDRIFSPLSICAAERALSKRPRNVWGNWVKRLFQRLQSKKSYDTMIRELHDEDLELFRAYLFQAFVGSD